MGPSHFTKYRSVTPSGIHRLTVFLCQSSLAHIRALWTFSNPMYLSATHSGGSHTSRIPVLIELSHVSTPLDHPNTKSGLRHDLTSQKLSGANRVKSRFEIQRKIRGQIMMVCYNSEHHSQTSRYPYLNLVKTFDGI